MSPKADVRPRTSSWSRQLAKFRMLLTLNSAAFLTASSIMMPSRAALASLSSSTGASTRSTRTRWSSAPAKSFIDSAGPRISLPSRNGRGRRRRSVSRAPPLTHRPARSGRPASTAALLTSGCSTVGTITCSISRPLRSAHHGASGLRAEADTDDVAGAPGDVEIGGSTAAAADLIDLAVDDEAVRSNLLHHPVHRGPVSTRSAR